MDRIIYQASRVSKIWTSIIVTIVYVILLVIYQRGILGLEKPAGVGEAITFLFEHPSDYAIALFVGILLHIIAVVVIASAIMCIIGALLSILQFKASMVVSLVIGIIMLVLNSFFAQYVMSLVLAVAIIGGIGWVFINSDN